MKRHLAHGAGIWAYGTLGSLTLFAASLALARWLSPEEMGTYAITSALFGLMSVTALPGMRSAVTSAVARGNDGTYRAGTILTMKSAIPGSVMLAACAAMLASNTALAASIAAAALLFTAVITAQMHSAYLIGKRSFGLQARIGFAATALGITLMLGGAYSFRSAWSALTGMMIGQAAIGGMAAVAFYRKIGPHAPTDRTAIAFGKNAGAGEMLATCAHHLDTVMIGLFLGPSPAALYYFAKLIPEQFKEIPKVISLIAMPEFSRMGPAKLRRTTWLLTACAGTALAAAAILYAIWASAVFIAIIPEYAAAVPYSIVFALSAISFMNDIPYHAVQARLLAKETVAISGIPAIMSIALMGLMIPLWGVWGAVIAKCATRAISLALSLTIAARSLPRA